jgi:anti-sigma B factor antagonist
MAAAVEIIVKDIPGHDKAKLIEIVGDLDRGSVKDAREKIISFIEKGNVNLVVDLSGLNFCDSTGILVLVHSYIKVVRYKGYFKLCRIPTDIFRLLEMIGLTKIMPIYNTVEEALHDTKVITSEPPSIPGVQE